MFTMFTMLLMAAIHADLLFLHARGGLLHGRQGPHGLVYKLHQREVSVSWPYYHHIITAITSSLTCQFKTRVTRTEHFIGVMNKRWQTSFIGNGDVSLICYLEHNQCHVMGAYKIIWHESRDKRIEVLSARGGCVQAVPTGAAGGKAEGLVVHQEVPQHLHRHPHGAQGESWETGLGYTGPGWEHCVLTYGGIVVRVQKSKDRWKVATSSFTFWTCTVGRDTPITLLIAALTLWFIV